VGPFYAVLHVTVNILEQRKGPTIGNKNYLSSSSGNGVFAASRNVLTVSFICSSVISWTGFPTGSTLKVEPFENGCSLAIQFFAAVSFEK
jgi:hypothetical protein